MDPIGSIIPGMSGGASGAAATPETGQDTFLRLLTSQLQNQDPTNPMSNEDFVAQLAQFSSLEQLVGLQQTMDSVYMAMASMNNASMASLLGTDVVAYGDTFHYGGEGSEALHYNAPRSFSSATLTVTDETGRVVATREIGSGQAGEGNYTFDGLDHDGQPLPEGDYTFSIEAVDDTGATVDVVTMVSGTVTEMDYGTGTPRPSIDGVAVGLENIVRLQSGTTQS